MNVSDRMQSRVVLVADLLESRELLNAHLPQSPIGHVTSLHAEAKAPRPITGKLNNEVLFVPISPTNPTGAGITFSGSGTSTAGTAHLSGRAGAQNQPPIFVARTVILTSVKIVNGTGTLTLGNGSKLALNFNGSSKSGTSMSPHTATYALNRTATVQSGPNQGQVETFNAMGTGPSSKLDVTFRFTLK